MAPGKLSIKIIDGIAERVCGRIHQVAGQFKLRAVVLLILNLASQGCSVDSVKNRYLLAEKLWADGNYQAAVTEFDRVSRRDPEGNLGRRALLRSAMTQTLFLNEHSEAQKKLEHLIEQEGDSDLAWEARKQIGEVLFSRLENHRASIKHYQSLVAARPRAQEVAEFLFRIGMSNFQGWAFDQALLFFDRVQNEYPGTEWAEKSAYQSAMVWLTRGEQRPGPIFLARGRDVYQQAIAGFDRFLMRFPNTNLRSQAIFGKAVALEELDQLDLALIEFEKIQNTYPTPQVVQIRMFRLRERLARRRR
jgi:TolA-binding protein